MADGNARRIETGELTGLNLLNPYIQGIYEPVAKEVTALDLKVIGELPKDLHGAYYRNGPNPVHAPQALHHWFDGDGMLHAIYFENGKAEYRNRYIRSDDFKAELAGTLDAGGVLFPANRARENKVYKDTANTDVIIHNGQLMALWYISGTPVRVNSRTLETIGNETFGGKLPRNVSAHSKVDPDTGEFVFFDYSLYEPWMTFGTVSPTNELVHFGKVDLPGPRLPHDMGLTKNYIVLHDLPVIFSESGMRNSMWQIKVADQPARFGVVPRRGRGDEIKWFETDSCYIYHVINTWEEGDEVVMTACMMTPNGFAPNPEYGPYAAMVNILALHAVPVEWRMNMRTGECKKRVLDDRIGEFPVVNLDYAAKKSRWSYHVAMSSDQLQKFKGLFKYDLQTGDAKEYMFEPGLFGSEPAYAPRINAKSEDDGYVIVFATNENTGVSECQVIDAQNFEAGPIARVQIPARVPAGFHGTWARGDQMAG
ncbi:carotenoid oxygenase family protein [Candidatus Viadribacter manganicus]|uniref:Dioxygenase n=1 Tax=Candidatus Viadribacter manganicus TaxID=1759059 RepID=A0A1B1AE44_9PROT|nr:carotenoid oxygenase family protein [Candidatus Viadribacter manganicus]ANP44828.1 9-cis-epoxycarotenoid dioxygenase [Candidatus Viadribacter manganicus]